MSNVAYIVGGYSHTGSGYIAYRIAQLLQIHFDYQCIIVAAQPNPTKHMKIA